MEGSPEDPGVHKKEGECKADSGTMGARPDLSGVCTCPEGKPLCVMRARSGLLETSGCKLPDVLGGRMSSNQYEATCADCACRESCPAQSREPFADAYGECRCADETPDCYQGGVKGCVARSNREGPSSTYFKSSCGKDECECKAAVGNCEPKTCLTSAECVFEVCRDCQMCLGISRCAQEGVTSEFLDVNGNCHCGGELSCFQPGTDLPGCPIAPLGESTTAFRGNCRGCRCKKLPSGAQIEGLQCPTFARNVEPDRYGDCECPSDAPDCYQAGINWCNRNDNRRDLHYFSVACTNCDCRAAVQEVEIDRQKPCPAFARHELSDGQGNCACPLEKPLCVEGVWPELADGEEDLRSNALKARPGPLCNTTYGWLSSTNFRFDCGEDCSCIEVEGEGSRLGKIQPSELMVRPEGSYMKHYMYLDIRVINSLDSISDWTEAEQDLTTDAFPSYNKGIAGGLMTILPAAAVVKNLTIRAREDVRDPSFEFVRALRLRIDFGVMWIWGRRLQSSRKQVTPTFSGRQLQDVEKGVEEVVKLKTLDELSARETNLLLNFASVFNERDFKLAFEKDINAFVNETWEGRKGNSSDDPLDPSNRLMAPHVEATRVVVDSEATASMELTLTGPLALNPPVLRPMDRTVVEQAEAELPVQLIGMIVGGVLGLVLVVMFTLCLVRRIRRFRARRRAKAGSSSASESQGGDGSPTGSPRGFGAAFSVMKKKKTEKTKPTHLTMYQRSSQSEIRGSMMLGGHGPAKDDANEVDADASPRTRAKARANMANPKESEEKTKARKKLMKKLGDLNGMKSLSKVARDALEAEYNLKYGGKGSMNKANSSAKAKGSKSGSPRQSSPGGSPDMSPRSPGASPDGSPRVPKTQEELKKEEEQKSDDLARKRVEMRKKMGAK